MLDRGEGPGLYPHRGWTRGVNSSSILFSEALFDMFLPVLDIVPPEQVIDIGREARLECLTEERDRASILWRKDGEVISPSSNIVQAS